MSKILCTFAQQMGASNENRSQIVTIETEDDFLRSQNATSSGEEKWKSQIAISNSIKMGARKLPYAFTENGIAMLSSVLRSPMAIATNIHIML